MKINEESNETKIFWRGKQAKLRILSEFEKDDGNYA